MRSDFAKIVLIWSVLFTRGVFAAQPGENRDIDFARDIRPILDQCVTCHGGVNKYGGFSVIERQLFLAPTDSGEPVVILGKAQDSELIRRVTSDDADERMPPEEPLQPREIARLQEWVDTGALWPGHWAYQSLRPQSHERTNKPSKNGPDKIDRLISVDSPNRVSVPYC